MNKGKILNFILARYEYEDTLDDELLESIRETIEEMQIAQCMFNYVNDPKLIEAAIYREDAAKKKFEYLLSLAKEKQMNKKIMNFFKLCSIIISTI